MPLHARCGHGHFRPVRAHALSARSSLVDATRVGCFVTPVLLRLAV